MDSGFYRVAGTRAEQYEGLIEQIRPMMDRDAGAVANMANISAMLKWQFDWHWVGFYLVRDNELVLGPFQGPPACTRIAAGRGVCGACMEKKESILVEDVRLFPGHIACSPLSLSELVVPVIRDGELRAVLDADSDRVAGFDLTDKEYLEIICSLIP